MNTAEIQVIVFASCEIRGGDTTIKYDGGGGGGVVEPVTELDSVVKLVLELVTETVA